MSKQVTLTFTDLRFEGLKRDAITHLNSGLDEGQTPITVQSITDEQVIASIQDRMDTAADGSAKRHGLNKSESEKLADTVRGVTDPTKLAEIKAIAERE